MEPDVPAAFAVSPLPAAGIEVRVNFGILAGREATPAEIESLARTLLAIVPSASIVSEQRHEVGDGREAVVHQVRVEVPAADSDAATAALQEQLVAAAGVWAQVCADARHAEI